MDGGHEGIRRSELEKLPYFKSQLEDGRLFFILTYYERADESWHLYLPTGKGSLQRMLAGEVISGQYLATKPADVATDIESPLGTLIYQHLSYPRMERELPPILNDIHQCAAVLEKYHVLWRHRAKAVGLETSILVQSELEYLLLLLRSYYDALQALVTAIADQLSVTASGEKALNKPLPPSFAKVALFENRRYPWAEIQERYKLPENLAKWYEQEAEVFELLRALRDRIVHRGGRLPTIFECEGGFAVDPSDPPWDQLHLWPADQLDGKLGSLRIIFAGLIRHALGASSRLSLAIRSCVVLPPTALKDHVRLFIRSPFGARLVQLDAMMAQPWEGLDASAPIQQ
ncbi:MAG: hypothetical protein M3505_08780 [Verrucomicrobiota bacterium]|nr:hypothetical protein [Acidobacteriota bacterium]MDQ3314705.1 hypothetical protein [Verrucomicrobiota bacterium]